MKSAIDAGAHIRSMAFTFHFGVSYNFVCVALFLSGAFANRTTLSIQISNVVFYLTNCVDLLVAFAVCMDLSVYCVLCIFVAIQKVDGKISQILHALLRCGFDPKMVEWRTVALKKKREEKKKRGYAFFPTHFLVDVGGLHDFRTLDKNCHWAITLQPSHSPLPPEFSPGPEVTVCGTRTIHGDESAI